MTVLHHEILGPDDAPVLVLAGSLGTTLEMWDGQLPLSEGLRLVRIDHRGHGRSPVPPGPYEIADLARDVLDTLDDLGLDRAHYCGISIGGMVGTWLGASAPERLDRLILICTSAHMPPPSLWQDRIRTVLEAGSVEPIADAVVERWLTPDFAAAHPHVRDSLRAMLAASPPQGYAACCGAIERMDLRPSLPQVRVPTVVISGAQDLATPVSHQELIAASIPGARHEVVGPAAHIAAVEQPEPINRLIQEHLS